MSLSDAAKDEYLTVNHDSATLMEKWEKCYNTKPKGNKTKQVSRFVFLFMATTLLYTMLRYTIRYCYGGYDSWTIYYIKVLVAYCFIMCVANWLCVILYDSAVIDSRDRPFPCFNTSGGTLPTFFRSSQPLSCPSQVKSRQLNIDVTDIKADTHKISQDQNGNCFPDKEVLDWKYCMKCKLQTPPRSHHCDVCGRCILKRDHHCYFLGVCIGFKNQRYFVVMTFYSMIVSLWGLYVSIVYLRDNVWPNASGSDFILPVAIYRTIWEDFPTLHCLMVLHCYMLWLSGPLSLFYFSSQFTIISKGLTLYELAKNIPVRNTNSVDKNLRSVFGDFWACNFIFPSQIVFRQRETGYFWDGVKIANTSDK